MKIVLFNGPPGSGKDTAVDLLMKERAALQEKLQMMVLSERFAAPLKDAVHVMVGRAYTEQQKEIPQIELGGLTPRQVYIAMAETFVKPTFGPDAWARFMLNRIEWGNTLYLVRDLGFIEEARTMINEVGPENVLIIRLLREGKSFKGDSRSYISTKDYPWACKEYTIQNNEDTSKLFFRTLWCIYDWMGIA